MCVRVSSAPAPHASLLSQLGTVILSATFALMGVTMLPLLPIALQCAVECTYPMPEESSAGLLMLVGNLLGLGFTYAIQGLCALTPDAAAVDTSPGLLPFGWFALAVVAGAMGVVFGFNGQYLRLQADQAGGADRLLAVAVEHPPAPQSPALDALPAGGSPLGPQWGAAVASADPYPVGERSPPPPPPELR